MPSGRKARFWDTPTKLKKESVHKSKYQGKKNKHKLLGSELRAGIRGDEKGKVSVGNRWTRDNVLEELGKGIKEVVLWGETWLWPFSAFIIVGFDG